MPQLEPTMFREYDLRGRVNGTELNEKTAEIIAKGFSRFLANHKINQVVIGYDAREYSERLKNAFVKGLLQSGINVIDIGQAITPILYFSQYHLKSKGGVMITASHNPNGWSGFKLGYDLSVTLLPDDIKELYQIIFNDDFVSGQGEYKTYKNIAKDYKNFILSKVNLKKKLKVVVDCGNGTAGPIAPKILRAAGCDVVEQFCEIDFNFPNHEPNPTLDIAQKALSEKVLAKKADLGLGFDGDGDRLGLCDEKGQVILADQALILLARQALKEKPGSAIVYDVKSTRGLLEDISAHGGKPVIWKTGHSYIKQKAKEVDAALAGETSGHIFYRHGYYGYDDAIFAALKLLEYISNENKTLSELMATIPQYAKSPTIHVHCDDKIKYDIVEKLTAQLKKDFGAENVIDINGARVQFPDGWFLVRASSNEPVLVLIFEAKTAERLEEFKTILKKYLAEFPKIGKEWKSG